MPCAQEILMKKQVDYMWKVIRKNGVSLSFFMFCLGFGFFLLLLLLLFVFVSFFLGLFFVLFYSVVLFFWFFRLTNVYLTLFKWLFRGCSQMGGQRGPLPQIFHTYPTMMKLGTVIPYLKKIQKIYKSRNKPCDFRWHKHFFFFAENQKILIYQEIKM